MIIVLLQRRGRGERDPPRLLEAAFSARGEANETSGLPSRPPGQMSGM
jgi:hypothetical protein